MVFLIMLMTIAIQVGYSEMSGETTGVSAGKGPTSWSDFQVPFLDD
jgi:hypothetical protein